MYDIIGDIHGYADTLEQLLTKLGYEQHNNVYQHPERKVIFLGDFIDRGPKILRVLQIARSMVEGGHALAVLGNHEMNALAFHTPNELAPGEYLRRHTEKIVKQHRSTVEQLAPGELQSYLNWFRTLPLWLELDGLRAVHACWDERFMEPIHTTLTREPSITSAFLHEAYCKNASLYKPIEVVLKGKEAKLPEGYIFRDKEGIARHEVRTRWYLAPDGHTFATYALQTDPVECHEPLTNDVIADALPYPADAKPVFIGHYWLSAPVPSTLTTNIACLDFSVAKSGFLCAYRWNGERLLSNTNFVWVHR